MPWNWGDLMSEPSPIIFSAPDAGSRSAGEALRVAREAQGLTLEGLAANIKVAPAKLEALEQGRYDQLPDASFTRALAMTVCRSLKLDPAGVLAALPAASPVSLATGKPPLNQPFKESRGGSPLFDKHLDWSALLSFKWLAPIVLLLGAVLIYALPKSIQLPAWVEHLTQAAPQAAAPASSEAPEQAASALAPEPLVMAADPAPSAPVADAASAPAASASAVSTLKLDTADSANAATSGGGQSPAGADPRLGGVVPAAGSQASGAQGTVAPSSLSLTASESAWVEIRDARGQKVLSRHVVAGESLALEGEAPLTLRIGNAAAVQLSFRGQPIDLVPHTRSNVARLELK
jgi:cytoskeleton protein RodZ